MQLTLSRSVLRNVISVTFSLMFGFAGDLVGQRVVASESSTNPTLALRLEEESAGDPKKVIVRVSIENVTTRTAWVYHEFAPISAKGRMRVDPLNYLTFSIVDDRGEQYAHIGNPARWNNVDNIDPRIHDVVALKPGGFIGISVNLSHGIFSHGLVKPGSYRIRAHFESRAGKWFAGPRAAERVGSGSYERMLAREVFDNALQSNEIIVRLR